MADNYLERHYEEYKAKKLGKVRPKKTVQPKTDAPKKQSGV